MKELQEIFEKIKRDHCSLWTTKERGETLEIITPYITTTNKFISVFLTTKNKEFIVSDGGQLTSDVYETKFDFKEDAFLKAFTYYERFFAISVVKSNGLDFFYKRTRDFNIIPNLVFELSNFISAVANTSQIQFTDIKEKTEATRFSKAANEFIYDAFAKGKRSKVNFTGSIDEDRNKNIRFSAVLREGIHITLINYITGSTPDYFATSIGSANIKFEVANKSSYSNFIKNKIALINDTAPGFEPAKVSEYLEQLESTTNNRNYFWQSKEELFDIL